MSSVENVDVRNQLLTFKSNDGRLWLMRVADPAAMKRESLAKGDVVSIEVGLDDQIVRIEKVGLPLSLIAWGRDSNVRHIRCFLNAMGLATAHCGWERSGLNGLLCGGRQ